MKGNRILVCLALAACAFMASCGSDGRDEADSLPKQGDPEQQEAPPEQDPQKQGDTEQDPQGQGDTEQDPQGQEDTEHQETQPEFESVLTHRPHDEVIREFSMSSEVGCALDEDCKSGLFCFHGLCTSECNEHVDCPDGKKCSANGHCVSNSASGTKKPEKLDSVIESIPGIEVLFAPDSRVYVQMGAKSGKVSLVTTRDFGRIDYTVSKPEEGTVSVLMHSEPVTDMRTGMVNYSFVLPAKDSSLGDKGKNEFVVLDTSAGVFEITMVPMKPTSGIYSGHVSASQFGGVGLPFRVAIETVPAEIKKFDDITAMTLYLPSSGQDLFSSEIVTEPAKTKWSKVVMTRDSVCVDTTDCWSASYSTNNYTFPGSKLLNADQKVNRSIRIEVSGYDLQSMMFDGSIRDIMSGFYREADASGKVQWSKAVMEGNFIITRSEALDTTSSDFSIKTHKKQAESLRELSETGADVCTDSSIQLLMAYAKCLENAEGCDLSVCAEIKTLEEYRSSEDAHTCLIAASEAILSEEKLVSKIIEKLIVKETDDLTEVYGFKTLQEFMNDCGTTNGICKERPELLCAVDLLGRDYLVSSDAEKVNMLASWHQLLRESYLGRQFSAWQNDVAVRRKWLMNSDSPSFLASVLETINKSMLKEWESNVFLAHRNVLTQQFNQTSLEVLTRVDNDSEISSNRDLILAEFAEGWEGVTDSMSLGLRRYDTLLQSTSERKAKAAEMRPHLFDLYFSGLMETAINRATGNGSLNGSYGKNLFENVARLRSLDQSFDDLVFMRDAEVVTSTSLNPLEPNSNVLSSRQKLAKETVKAAQEKRDKVFDDYDTKNINKAQINAMLTSATEALMTEIVDICGLPRGCSFPTESNCAPRIEPGFCGFDLPSDASRYGDLNRVLEVAPNASEVNAYYSGGAYQLTESDLELIASQGVTDETKLLAVDYYSFTNTGEAAKAIMAYRSAQKNVDIAMADFIALNNKVSIAKSTCDRYAQNLEEWNKSRINLLKTIQANIERINEHYDNITEAERQKIDDELALAIATYNQQAEYVKNWESLVDNYTVEQTHYINMIKTLQNIALSTEYATSVVDRTTEAAASFFDNPTETDKMFGFSTFGLIGGGIKTAGNLVAAAMEAVTLGMNIAINNSEATKEIREMLFEFKLNGNELANELAIQGLELALQSSLAVYKQYPSEEDCLKASEISGSVKCRSTSVCDCSGANEDFSEIYSEVSCPKSKGCLLTTSWYVMGLDKWILSEQNAIDTLDEVNDTLRELFEVQNAYNRDLQELDFKRSEYLMMAQDLLVKREQILKAQIDAYSALKHYYSVVQRAMMLQSQYDAANARLMVINNLYSTPAAIFSFASDIEVVESKIDLAKERIYDYLSAVEYLAVRPFVDLRRATYLARSTNDLDAIISEIDTIVAKCGSGALNNATVEISAREMMGITRDFANMTMSERFRAVIAKGNIPINSLTRYTVDTNVRDLVSKGSDLRSGSFAVTIDKSMNLATTCNAKIASIAIKIVGDDIIRDGEGTNVTPTITVFYDGQSQLVSCQPNIKDLVSMLGSKTSYGQYSSFIVEPTKISPTAQINEFGEANVTLAGKPFATSYTVLIDTQISENRKIDWDKVDDIILKVNYTYQDLFSQSSQCVNL